MLFFCLFQCFRETEYQTESKRNETFGNVIFSPNVIQGTWTLRQETKEAVTRVEGTPLGRAPLPRGPLKAPPTYFFLLYIPTYPQTIGDGARKHNSTAATFCIHKIPSWALFWSFVGRGIDHGGLLHHHPSPSDEV